MSQRNAHLGLLIAAQAICAAIGMWLHYQYTVSLVAQQDLAAALEKLPATSVTAFLWICGLSALSTFVLTARYYDRVSGERSESEHKALRQAQALLRTRDAIIFGLAKLAESRDPETGQHLERISLYSSALAASLRRQPEYRDVATAAFIRNIEVSAVLHDIGKVGIEDDILLWPGPLSDEQRRQMQRHTTIGGECLRQIEQRLGRSNFLQMSREIAMCHHERWDGSGYPAGLAGRAIPLAARIVAIADVYDALASRRVYKQPRSHEECVAAIRGDSGRHFDPALVEVFLEIESRFREIARQYEAHAAAASEKQPVSAVDIVELAADEPPVLSFNTATARTS